MLEGYGITLRVFNQVIVRVALLKAFYQWVVHLLSQQVLNVQIRRFWVFDRLNKMTAQISSIFFWLLQIQHTQCIMCTKMHNKSNMNLMKYVLLLAQDRRRDVLHCALTPQQAFSVGFHCQRKNPIITLCVRMN